MDKDGNVKNSTLIIGAAVSLVLIVAATLITEAVAPFLANWAFLPAVVFVSVYISVVRSKGRPKGREVSSPSGHGVSRPSYGPRRRRLPTG